MQDDRIRKVGPYKIDLRYGPVKFAAIGLVVIAVAFGIYSFRVSLSLCHHLR